MDRTEPMCPIQIPDLYPIEDRSLDPELTPLVTSDETDKFTEEGLSLGSNIWSRESEAKLEHSSNSLHSSCVGKLLGGKYVAVTCTC
jgi:hypothetical protein